MPCLRLLFSLLMLSPAIVVADSIEIAELDRKTPVSFEKEIIPLLQENCLACHSATENQGNLVLESVEEMLDGGDTGPAIVAGDSSESLLLHLATHEDEPHMPPADNDVAARNLTSDELGLIKLWIDQGAKSSTSGSSVSALSPTSWQPLPEGIHPVYAVSLSSDGQFVACSRANHIYLYHVGSGQLITKMTDPELQNGGLPGIAHRDLVQSLSFNVDGDLLASGGFREVKLWRRPRDVQRQQMAADEQVRTLALSPDRKFMAINAADNAIQIKHADTGNEVRKLVGHEADVTAIRYSTSGQHLISGSLDHCVLIWNSATGDLIGQISTPSPINDVTLVPTTAPTEQNPHPPFQIVTAGDDKIVRVWALPSDASVATTQSEEFDLVTEFKSHSQPVTCLAAIPNRPGEVLSGSRDSTIRWWRTSNGSQTRQFSHGGPVNAVAVSPDGQTIASAGDNMARLWRTNGQTIAQLKGDIRLNTAVARAKQQQSSADSRVAVAKRQLEDLEKDIPKKEEAEKKLSEALAKANKDVTEQETAFEAAKKAKLKAEQDAIAAAATVRDVQAEIESAQANADIHTAKVKQLQARADQLQKAVSASPANEPLKQLLADAKAAVTTAQQQLQQATSAVAEPKAKLKAATDKANATAQEIDKVQKPYNDISSQLKAVQREQNLTSQKHVLAATELKQAQEQLPVRKEALQLAEAALKRVQDRVKSAEETAKAAEQATLAMAFSEDGDTLLTAGRLGVIHSWSTSSGAPIGSYAGHNDEIRSVAWLEGNTILSAGHDQTIRSWETNPGWRLERTIGAVDDPKIISHRVTAVDFSHDSKRLLAGSGMPSRDGELHVFNVDNGKQLLRIEKAHDDVVYSAKFSPDASRIASAGADKYLRTFDASSGKQLRRFEGHTNYVLGVAWKSDGQTLATAAADNTVKIWDVETADQKRTVSNFKRHITSLTFSGNSDNVFCVCGDRTTRMLRISNGGTVRTFNGASHWLHCGVLSADGRIAAAGDADGNVLLWDTTNGRLLHTLSK